MPDSMALPCDRKEVGDPMALPMRRTKEKQRVGILRRRGRTVGRFHYEVTRPGNVDGDGIVAYLADGVLTVRVPKPRANDLDASPCTDRLLTTATAARICAVPDQSVKSVKQGGHHYDR
jgi:Hsp20/alpha crystallin family